MLQSLVTVLNNALLTLLLQYYKNTVKSCYGSVTVLKNAAKSCYGFVMLLQKYCKLCL